MRIKTLLLLALAISVLTAQQCKIEDVTVSGAPPSLPVTCTNADSGYGYLRIGQRIDLTASEIGEYVVDTTRNGTVLTVYPKSTAGIFVHSHCPKPEPKP